VWCALAANAHPTYFGKEKEVASCLEAPIIVLAADDDPMETVKEVTDTKPWGAKCVFKRFEGQTHGFMAARGDWTDHKVSAAATDGFDMFSAFLKANLA